MRSPSPTRRGRLTAHRALASDHSTQGLRGDSAHFGTSSAILVGDLCLVWADKLMSRSSVAAHTLVRARAGYDVMRVETIAGQFLVFRVARAAVLRQMGWRDIDPAQVQAITGVIQQSARAMLLAARAENSR